MCLFFQTLIGSHLWKVWFWENWLSDAHEEPEEVSRGSYSPLKGFTRCHLSPQSSPRAAVKHFCAQTPPTRMNAAAADGLCWQTGKSDTDSEFTPAELNETCLNPALGLWGNQTLILSLLLQISTRPALIQPLASSCCRYSSFSWVNHRGRGL